jgi:hypothetical protein
MEKCVAIEAKEFEPCDLQNASGMSTIMRGVDCESDPKTMTEQSIIAGFDREADESRDPEREPELTFGCNHCRDFTATAPNEAAMDIAIAEHRATPAHDRNYEAFLRRDIDCFRVGLENARTALYDYLKSKGRVA